MFEILPVTIKRTTTHIQTEDKQNIKYKTMRQNYLDGKGKHGGGGRKK